MEKIREALLGRFLRYAKTCTESCTENADKGIMPSTPQQREMAELLRSELESLGLEGATVTEHCYAYARLPASDGMEGAASVCLLSHIDTADEVSGKNVRPIVHEKYSGEKITLPSGTILDPAEDAELFSAGKNRETVITSDGTTLLGADDKAGIAEIMTALEFLARHPEKKHREIEVIFSPDEETGHGMDKAPLELLKSKCAYTVDGGKAGELETECFNAFKSEITFTGNATHTGTARGKMVNAVLMASSFTLNLPRGEMPETTDGRMGFFAPMDIEGSIERSRVTLLLRDFSMEGIERRKKIVEDVARTVAVSFGGKAEVSHTRQYLNMKQRLDEFPQVTERLVRACRAAGIEPEFSPIRGGTDGSRLAEMGIPAPNIFTGGHNFHSRSEWASLEQMQKAAELLIHLATDTQSEIQD